jgi:hypothetical protein
MWQCLQMPLTLCEIQTLSLGNEYICVSYLVVTEEGVSSLYYYMDEITNCLNYVCAVPEWTYTLLQLQAQGAQPLPYL